MRVCDWYSRRRQICSPPTIIGDGPPRNHGLIGMNVYSLMSCSLLHGPQCSAPDLCIASTRGWHWMTFGPQHGAITKYAPGAFRSCPLRLRSWCAPSHGREGSKSRCSICSSSVSIDVLYISISPCSLSVGRTIALLPFKLAKVN